MKQILALLLFAIPAISLAEDPCAPLDSEKCIISRECILDKKDTDYFCRRRKEPCEIGIPYHRDERATICASREGCEVSGKCYCACNDKRHPNYGSCDCACGGGLPPDCREAEKSK